MHSTFDTVDVHITSTKSQVDAILKDPLLDGQKKYTVEVTEFSAPLTTEPPLLKNTEFAANVEQLLLMRVRRKNIGEQPGANTTLLSTTPVIGNLFTAETFIPNTFRPIRTPQDLVYYLQRYFDDIKKIYTDSLGGIDAGEHGGGNDVDLDDGDLFADAVLTPNCTLRIFLSEDFVKHFWIETTEYSKLLLGFKHTQIAFRTAGGVLLQGPTALTNNTPNIVVGESGETVVIQGGYPLTRHFDHRVRLELQTDMPIPQTVVWNTDNTQKISHVISTFPINMRTESSLTLNSEGANNGEVTLTSDLFSGDIVWRRAEDKISERYEILNSQFFQNIRLEAFITRRVWLPAPLNEFSFKRYALTLASGESWEAKLRFRTL